MLDWKSHTFESSRPSAANATPCITSQVEIIQRSDQNKSQGVSFASTHLATQAVFVRTIVGVSAYLCPRVMPKLYIFWTNTF